MNIRISKHNWSTYEVHFFHGNVTVKDMLNPQEVKELIDTLDTASEKLKQLTEDL